MKKFLLLVVLIITMGAVPIVANAKETNADAVAFSEDNCIFVTKKVILEEMLKAKLLDCSSLDEEKATWDLYESLDNISEAEVDKYLNTIYPALLVDIDEDGRVTNRDILNYAVCGKIRKYDNSSYQEKELCSIYEEVKRFPEEDIDTMLKKVLLGY